MATVRIPARDQTFDDERQAREHLAAIGITWEVWRPTVDLGDDGACGVSRIGGRRDRSPDNEIVRSGSNRFSGGDNALLVSSLGPLRTNARRHEKHGLADRCAHTASLLGGADQYVQTDRVRGGSPSLNEVLRVARVAGMFQVIVIH